MACWIRSQYTEKSDLSNCPFELMNQSIPNALPNLTTLPCMINPLCWHRSINCFFGSSYKYVCYNTKLITCKNFLTSEISDQFIKS
jgi:hypothetical protein